MNLTLLSMALYALGIGLFGGWFVVANGLGRDASPEGVAADLQRRKRMQALMTGGWITVALALLLPLILHALR